jgi:hypothetical protein
MLLDPDRVEFSGDVMATLHQRRGARSRWALERRRSSVRQSV